MTRLTDEQAVRIAHAAGFAGNSWTMGPEELAHLLKVAAQELSKQEPVAYRCFHCREEFTNDAAAELHFGRSELDKPACQISIGHVRWLEQQHHRGVQDDTEALRTIRGILGEHETLRRRAEEEGYAKGIADARKHPEDIGLIAAPPLPSTPDTDTGMMIERPSVTYTQEQVRTMVNSISADARQFGLEIVDHLDGKLGLRALAAPDTVQVPRSFLSEFVNVCEVCDINDTMPQDGYGWKELYQQAKAMIAAAPKSTP